MEAVYPQNSHWCTSWWWCMVPRELLRVVGEWARGISGAWL